MAMASAKFAVFFILIAERFRERLLYWALLSRVFPGTRDSDARALMITLWL